VNGAAPNSLLIRGNYTANMLNRPEVTADQRSALELLANAGPHGCTGATLFAHGFKIGMLAELVRDGLATARRQPLKAGERQIEVARIRITDAGRRALEG
jgi:hypothetical protein